MTPLRLWRALRRRRDDDDILREEIASHLTALEGHFRSQGLSEDAARIAARRQFGNVSSLRERRARSSASARSSGSRRICGMARGR